MADVESNHVHMGGGDASSSSVFPPNTKRRTSIRGLFNAILHLMPNSTTTTTPSTSTSPALTPPLESPTKRISSRLSFYKRKSVEKDEMGSNRTNLTELVSEDSVSHHDTAANRDENIQPLVSFVDESGQPEQKRTSQRIKKRQSSRRFLGLSRDKSQKFEITDDMINLQRIICDKNYRQRLIELLVPLDGDSSVKVRFCSAVEEYQREKDKKEKTRKGAQIVKMFIKKGSLFRLKGIPKDQETTLKAKKYECLEDLKNIFLEELGHNQIVAKAMQDILSSEAASASSL